MAPFKFGKKKGKDGKDNSPVSSPSSQQTQNNHNLANNSPQASQFSNNSYNNVKQSNFNSPGTLPAQSPSAQHQQSGTPSYSSRQTGGTVNQPLGYDVNNNIYNPKSPQRSGAPSANPNSQVVPQFGLNRKSQLPGPQQQQSSPIQHKPQQLPSPWSRSKLLLSPFPRYRHTASTISNERGEIFVMGGLHNTSVYGDTWIIKSEDINAKSFQTFQVDIYDNSPAPRVGHASTLCGNAYVIFGGDTVTNDDGEIDNDLYLFNLNSHSWTVPHPIGKRPSGRYGHTIGVIAITNFDSKLYLYGGQLDDVVYNDLVVFNLSSFRRPDVQWEWVTPEDRIQPPGLTNHTMDVYDNKLWLFGGSTGKKLSNELWTFDPLKNRWDKIKTFGQIPPPIEEHASVVYNDLLLVHGGKNIHSEAIKDLHVLNLVTKTWFKLPSNLSLEPEGKYGHSISLLKNDKLLILGGHLPDFAQLGDNLEPSPEDNGVGTILTVLDLKHITKLIPGLYQYNTPNHFGAQEKFSSQHSIFSPPSQQSQISNTSPVKNQQTPGKQGSGQSSNYSSPGYDNQLPRRPSGASLNKTPAQRAISAEDAFQRSQTTPQRAPQRQGSVNSTVRAYIPDTPVTVGNGNPSSAGGYAAISAAASSLPNKEVLTPSHSNQPSGNANIYSSPEEDLPLQIPSPIRTKAKELPVPAPIKKDLSEVQQPSTFGNHDSKSTSTNFNTFDDDFQTPSASPVDEIPIAKSEISSSSVPELQKAEYASVKHAFEGERIGSDSYLTDDAKGSDFLDTYVNGASTVDLDDKDDEEPIISDSSYTKATPITTHSVSSDNEVPLRHNVSNTSLKRAPSLAKSSSFNKSGSYPTGAAGVAGTAAIGTGITAFVKDSSASEKVKAENTTRSLPGAFIQNTSSNLSLNKDDDEKQQFKTIINSLSAELENLKTSTNEQIKNASAKVKSLESENIELKQKVDSTQTKSLDSESVNDRELGESEIKRKHFKLNTDHTLLKKDHEQLRSKVEEIESAFSSNLIDLENLNAIIKRQNITIDENSRKLKEEEDWKLKYNELKLRYDALEEKSTSREVTDVDNTHTESIKKLTTGLDTFLAKYTFRNSETGEVQSRGLNGASGTSSIKDDEASESLRSQIDELLRENEEAEIANKTLTQEIDTLKSKTSEVDALKAKVLELSKIEENYKDTLHSVRNSSKALQISQSDLAKQKEITLKLQQEIDELRLFKSRKASRNATPIVNEYNKENNSNDDEDEDFENAHYNLKIRDLQAELFITKQERDELKQDVLELKKKLLVVNTPSSSF